MVYKDGMDVGKSKIKMQNVNRNEGGRLTIEDWRLKINQQIVNQQI